MSTASAYCPLPNQGEKASEEAGRGGIAGFENGGGVKKLEPSGWTKNDFDGNLTRGCARFEFRLQGKGHGLLSGTISWSGGSTYNSSQETQGEGVWDLNGNLKVSSEWTQFEAGDVIAWSETYAKSRFYYSGKIQGSKLCGRYKMKDRKAKGSFELELPNGTRFDGELSQGIEHAAVYQKPCEDLTEEPRKAAQAEVPSGCILWHGKPIPMCVCDRGAYERVIRDSVEEDTTAPAYCIDRVAAPAWKYAAWANVILWSFFCLCPVVSFMLASCDEDGGIAFVPSSVLLLWIPVLGASLVLEIKGHRYFLPAHAKWLDGTKLACVPLPCTVFVAMGICISATAHMDLATSGIFLAKVLKAQTCPNNDMYGVWSSVVHQSLMRFLPSLPIIALFLWIVILLQLIVAIGHSIPIGEGNISIKSLLQREEVPDKCYFIDTPFIGRVYPNASTNALAVSARMYLMNLRYSEFVCFAYEKSLKRLRPDRDCWASDMTRIAINAGAFLLLESCAQPNFQASVLLVSRRASGGASLDAETLASLGLSIFMALLNLTAAASRMRHMWGVIEPYCQEDNIQEVQDTWDNSRYDTKETVQARRRSVMRALLLFSCVAILTTILVVYAVVKLVMSVVVCETGLWNITGCAHF